MKINQITNIVIFETNKHQKKSRISKELNQLQSDCEELIRLKKQLESNFCCGNNVWSCQFGSYQEKKNRKCLVIEEAWKAIASPLMAEYIKYLYKTARKFWASVGVVTQEIQDIIGSPIVKEAIINNSDVVMLLDQSKFRERFDEIKAILGLTDVDCKKIFTINRLENKEGRSFFREVFIRRGSTSGVYGVEEPKECYMTYTTERAEKEALKLYKAELKCSHQKAIEAYCRDWNASGIEKSLPFAQKVNSNGKVLNIKN